MLVVPDNAQLFRVNPKKKKANLSYWGDRGYTPTNLNPHWQDVEEDLDSFYRGEYETHARGTFQGQFESMLEAYGVESYCPCCTNHLEVKHDTINETHQVKCCYCGVAGPRASDFEESITEYIELIGV